jgi:coenzyme F420-0:L-glutamate ligase/coenzyme F420-1:gamma-L-glutamate ligase
VTNGSLRLAAQPLPDIPEIEAGADLTEWVAQEPLAEGDVLVFAQKVVSKAEGRVRRLADVDPSERARELASRLDKDARMVQVILDESAEVMRAERGVLITRTHHGFVCANAGIDTSNVPGEAVTLLPEDPDASARRLRAAVRERTGKAPAVVISDSFGRAWRLGQVEVAIGCAGLHPLDDCRGARDALGAELTATELAVADEAAAAAGLVRDKAGREAIVLVHGLARYVTADDGPGATALVRPLAEDLFL